MADKVQTYANHTQIVPIYHMVTFPLILVTFIGACVNLYESIGDSSRLYSASLLVTLSLAVLILSFLARVFALKAQDRAIRAEEQLRHYVLTGKLLDPRLTIRQIVGLRFASDQELAALARRAAEQGLSPDDIKKAVTTWRPDTYRV
jgi:L-cystine uptake protein TcyP (sodium:dicarboxylate symporter family)